jgi:hypothetical protein
MDILNTNKPPKKFHYIQTYYKNKKNKTRIKQKINLRQKNYLAKKKKKKKNNNLLLWLLESLLFQALSSSLQKRRRREVLTNRGSKVARQRSSEVQGSETTNGGVIRYLNPTRWGNKVMK